MNKNKIIYDVFISHNHRNLTFVNEVSRFLRALDLLVFTDTEIDIGDQSESVIWEAMAESQALVAIISDNDFGANMAFELGAARAWNKPVYAVASDPTSYRLPPALHGVPVFTANRLEEMASRIKNSSSLLTKPETDILVEEYFHGDTTVDQLILQPNRLANFTKQFKKRAGRDIASEELLRSLLRLRKRGLLRPSESKKRPRVT